MIKLGFILFGLVCLAYVTAQFLSKKKAGKGTTFREDVEVFPCGYCGDYHEKEPTFENDVCQICGCTRSRSRK